MKLKYSFEAVNMGDEIISVPLGEEAAQIHGVLKLNPEGQEILELLNENITEEQVVDTLATRYENDRALLVGYVRRVLDVLRKADLLEE